MKFRYSVEWEKNPACGPYHEKLDCSRARDKAIRFEDLGIRPAQMLEKKKKIFFLTTSLGQHVNSDSPIKTEKKNCVIGTSKIGDDMLRNQFGDIGNNLKNNRKKNRLSRFSLT